jgi:hypothetical protein
MFVNGNATAVAPYFVPGTNTLSMTVCAQKGWEERPFDLHARFRVREPFLGGLPILIIMGIVGFMVMTRSLRVGSECASPESSE